MLLAVAAQKLHDFMQPRPVLDRQEHVLQRSKCGNLLVTLRSYFSNKFLTSWDNYLCFTPNYFKLDSLSDDITFVYANCVIVIGPEHPIYYSNCLLYFLFLFDKSDESNVIVNVCVRQKMQNSIIIY